jgi:glutathione S-transferase
MSNSALKLYYFNLRARAEIIRLIFAAAGRTWNDIRIAFTQWPEYKPKMLLGQCPVLELPDGTQIPQSLSIARYVARETGLAGKDDLESAKIDAVVDTQRDMNDVFHTKVLFEKDENKKVQELEKFLANDLFKYVEQLMILKKAYSTDTKYFVGNKLSWADLFVYQSIDRVIRAAPQMANQLDVHFKDTFETVNNNQNIKKYFDERPDTPFLYFCRHLFSSSVFVLFDSFIINYGYVDLTS